MGACVVGVCLSFRGCEAADLLMLGEPFRNLQRGTERLGSTPSLLTVAIYAPVSPLFSSCLCLMCHQVLGRKWEPRHRYLRFQDPGLRFLLPLWKTSRRHMKTNGWRSPESSSSRRVAWSAAQGCPACVG